MKYMPVLDLRLTHPFYTDGRCPDVLIEPTIETSKLLRNHRCVIKSTPGAIRVLTEVTVPVEDDDPTRANDPTAAKDAKKAEPLIPVSLGATFAFHLRITRPDFALFTDLTEIRDQADPFFTNTVSDSTNTKLLVVASRTHQQLDRFTVKRRDEDVKFTLQGRPLPGVTIADFVVQGSEAITEVAKYDAAGKVVVVDCQGAELDETFSVRYPVQPPLRRGLLADVEIQVNESFQAISDGPAEFEIAFSAKQVHWAYYCVTNLGGAPSVAELVDAETGETPAIQFSSTPLHVNPDPTDDVAEMLAKQYPEMQRFRFISDEPVPCRQTPRTNLRLFVNGQRVPAAVPDSVLPNPAFQNLTSVVVGDDASVQQDSLFQIVKYLPHSFPNSGG